MVGGWINIPIIESNQLYWLRLSWVLTKGVQTAWAVCVHAVLAVGPVWSVRNNGNIYTAGCIL